MEPLVSTITMTPSLSKLNEEALPEADKNDQTRSSNLLVRSVGQRATKATSYHLPPPSLLCHLGRLAHAAHHASAPAHSRRHKLV